MYASSPNHEFGNEVAADGHLDVLLSSKRFVRYIRIWVGASSPADDINIYEVQPMYRDDPNYFLMDEAPSSGVVTTNATLNIGPVATGSSSGGKICSRCTD